MPATHSICCKDKGSCVPIADCLEHAATRENKCGYTYEVLAAMFDTLQDRGERISTTLLTTKCLRQEAIARKEDHAVDPVKLYASFRGTFFHGLLETHAHPRAVAEPRYFATLDGLGELSGSPDLVDPYAGTLYDYKFTREVPRWDRAWSNHEEQVQVNRWLVDYAHTVEWQGDTYDLSDPANRAKFVPYEWRGLYLVYADDKGVKPILVTRSEQVPKKYGNGMKAARVADIWGDERVEGWIREKYALAQSALSGGVLPDIPEDFTGWRHPLCGWCSVKDRCVDLYIEQQVEIRAGRAS